MIVRSRGGWEKRGSVDRNRACCGPDLRVCSCSVGVSRKKRTQEMIPPGWKREASRMPEPRRQEKTVGETVLTAFSTMERSGRRPLQFGF